MRYFVAPRLRAESFDGAPSPPLAHPQVFVSEPVNTGIVDKAGNPIYRTADAIGFLAKKEHQ